MPYAQDLIDAVLKAADVVTVVSSYINVERRGRSYYALCPFHDDKSPSLNISKEKQIFKCFACGAGGNSIGFVKRYEKISFPEAVRKTAEIVGFSDPRLVQEAPKIQIDESKQKLYNCINDLNAFYLYGLTVEEGAKAREYLDSRNIDLSQRQKYGIGYSLSNGEFTIRYLLSRGYSLKNIEDIGIALAKSEGTSDNNSGRITFPLHDPNGQIVGFSARRLDGVHDRKYVNSPEGPLFHKGNILYNYHNVVNSAKRDGYCYVLEGFMDVMALDRAGLPNAVALMGTALTKEQVALLKKLRCELRICLDGDLAGQTGMMRMSQLLSEAGVPYRFVDYGDDLRDPDDILQQEGKEALKAKMENLIDAVDFQLSFYTHTKPLETSEDRQNAVLTFIKVIRKLPPGVEQENYIVKLARATGYEVEAIRSILNQSQVEESQAESVQYREAKDAELVKSLHPERVILNRIGMAERMILHYMFKEKEAIAFFQQYVKDFSNDVFETIAMSILEYYRLHPGEVALDGILSTMEAKEDEEYDHAIGVATDIEGDENYPPFSMDVLEKALQTIVSEKEEIVTRERTKRALSTSDPNQIKQALLEATKKKGQKWPKKNK